MTRDISRRKFLDMATKAAGGLVLANGLTGCAADKKTTRKVVASPRNEILIEDLLLEAAIEYNLDIVQCWTQDGSTPFYQRDLSKETSLWKGLLHHFAGDETNQNNERNFAYSERTPKGLVVGGFVGDYREGAHNISINWDFYALKTSPDMYFEAPNAKGEQCVYVDTRFFADSIIPVSSMTMETMLSFVATSKREFEETVARYLSAAVSDLSPEDCAEIRSTYTTLIHNRMRAGLCFQGRVGSPPSPEKLEKFAGIIAGIEQDLENIKPAFDYLDKCG